MYLLVDGHKYLKQKGKLTMIHQEDKRQKLKISKVLKKDIKSAAVFYFIAVD